MHGQQNIKLQTQPSYSSCHTTGRMRFDAYKNDIFSVQL